MPDAPSRRVRYRTEYLLVRACWTVFESLPIGLSSALARGLADCVYGLVASRRRIAVDNILLSSLGCTPGGARRMARESFRHFALCALEAVKLQPLSAPPDDGRWQRHVRVTAALPLLERVRDSSRGLVLASAHFGSWELGASVFAAFRPLVAIARPLDNPLVEAFVARRRFHGRVRTVPKHSRHPRRLVDLLKEGAALAVMIDTNAGRHGVTMDFLGRPAPTYASVARLQQAADVPVVLGYLRRTGRLAYEAGLLGPFACGREGSREAESMALLRRVHGALEDLVRHDPTQYLWAHRRWRFR